MSTRSAGATPTGEVQREHRCSFCGALPRHEHPRLGVVVGPGVNICADCVLLCAVVLAEEEQPEPRPCPYCKSTPEDITEHLLGPRRHRCPELAREGATP